MRGAFLRGMRDGIPIGLGYFAVSVLLALRGAKLPVVAAAACALVYIVELFF